MLSSLQSHFESETFKRGGLLQEHKISTQDLESWITKSYVQVQKATNKNLSDEGKSSWAQF